MERIDYASTLDHRTKMMVLAGVLMGLFLAALDQTIVATALPKIVSELHGIDMLAWVSATYLLASTAMVPIYGKLSDLFGRKPILLTGIGVFLLGSALCGLAADMLQLAIFRAVQGLGAAALTSTAFAIPADLFVPRERAKYQGIFGAVFGLSSIVGPYVGGLLTDHAGWRWVFYVNLPLGAVAAGFVFAKMPRLHSGLRAKVDYPGALLLLAAVVPFLFALTVDKQAHPWSSPLVAGCLAASAAAAALFVAWERRAASPIVPLHLFGIRTYAIVIGVSLLIGGTFLPSIMFLSLYLVNVLGVSATTAGTTLVPMTLAMVATSIATARVVHRTGKYKLLMLAGLVLIAASLFGVSRLGLDASLGEVRLWMAVLGVGLGPTLPMLNLALQNAVPYQHVGSATAGRQFFQQLGQAVGAAVFATLLAGTLTASLTASLAPLQGRLTEAQAARLSAERLRNGSGGEGTGERARPGDEIVRDAELRHARVAATFEAALAGDRAAAEAILDDRRLPGEVRSAVRAEAPTDAGNARAMLAAVRERDLGEARAVAAQVDAAVARAFMTGVTRIYRDAVPLVALAFLLLVFMPELPLRTSNRASVQVPE